MAPLNPKGALASIGTWEKNVRPLHVVGRAVAAATDPILFDPDQYLLGHEGTVLMIHQLDIPPHASGDLPDLVHCIDFVPQDDCTFGPQYAVHLQKNVLELAPVDISLTSGKGGIKTLAADKLIDLRLNGADATSTEKKERTQIQRHI